MNVIKQIPLIKEYRIEKLVKCLECIDKFRFNREKQKLCILEHYPNKNDRPLEHREKSIFRGMIIPSLRYMGLIIGFEDEIRPSANGKIIVKSKSIKDLHNRVLNAIIFELDKNIFGFIPIIKHSKLPEEKILNQISKQITGVSKKQKYERIKKWLSILKEVKLIKGTKILGVNKKNYNQAIFDTNIKYKNIESFKKYLFKGYSKISNETGSIVDIRELRTEVSEEMLKTKKIILTENQFDELLRKIPFETQNYIISLGEPMGAEEKLFEYKGEFFKTIYIKFYKGEKHGKYR